MRKILVILAILIGVGAVGYTVFYKKCDDCQVKYHRVEDEIIKHAKGLKIEAIFTEDAKATLDDLESGKVKCAFPFFTETDLSKHPNVKASEKVRTCLFGLYGQIEKVDLKTVTTIGYCDDFVFKTLKEEFPKAELKKYDSFKKAREAAEKGEVPAVCVSDFVLMNKSKNCTFISIPKLDKPVVFLFGKDSGVDLNAFNAKIKQINEKKPEPADAKADNKPAKADPKAAKKK